MKNILIPVDFSDTSLNAIAYAEAFFKNSHVNFYLLGVYVGSESKLMGDQNTKEWLSKMDDTVTNDLARLAEKYNDISDDRHDYFSVTGSGSLIDAIEHVIREKNIDLIVTGTKGASGFKEVFIGSNTMQMINHIDACPIMVVPTAYKFEVLDQIIFSTNFNRKLKAAELLHLIDVTLLHDAFVEVVQLAFEAYLTPKQKENKKVLIELLDEVDFIFYKIDLEDSETETIQKHILATKSDLLAIVNHKHNFFYNLTEENVIKKSAFHSEIPLLILPEIRAV